MKTPEQNPLPTNNAEVVPKSQKSEYLSRGYIDGSALNGMELEERMWSKTVDAVNIGGDTPKSYTGLQLKEFRDLKGYGFSLPDGGILVISRFTRTPEANPPLKNWVFKIE